MPLGFIQGIKHTRLIYVNKIAQYIHIQYTSTILYMLYNCCFVCFLFCQYILFSCVVLCFLFVHSFVGIGYVFFLNKAFLFKCGSLVFLLSPIGGISPFSFVVGVGFWFIPHFHTLIKNIFLFLIFYLLYNQKNLYYTIKKFQKKKL